MTTMRLLFPEGSRRREFVHRIFFQPRIPSHIRSNFVHLDDENTQKVEEILRQGFFTRESSDYLDTGAGKEDLLDHLIRRIEFNRTYTIPWLDSAKPLKNARVLDIGCGTGCSTVALAEQGAQVTAIDIDEQALEDNRKRCEVYNVDANIINLNAIDAAQYFKGQKFDFIIFWACLEHMTHEERIASIRCTWNMLDKGAFWCLTETPNRLWFFDSHTSKLPFFMWLPDDLAVKYASYSPRDKFQVKMQTDASVEALSRCGRGMSFHELEVALKPADSLDVVSCMTTELRKHKLLPRLCWRLSLNHRYESIIRRACPDIHPGFFQPFLDLIIRKH